MEYIQSSNVLRLSKGREGRVGREEDGSHAHTEMPYLLGPGPGEQGKHNLYAGGCVDHVAVLRLCPGVCDP